MANLFLIQMLNGLQFGVLLFLIAAGLTLIFGTMDFVNLAHGVLYMLGAYLVTTFIAVTGNFWTALLLMLPAIFLIGLSIEFLILRRLYSKTHLDQVLATFGLVMVGNETVKILWGTAPIDVAVPQIFEGTIRLFGMVNYPIYRLAIIAAGVLVAVGLFTLINHTRIGMRLRAGTTHRGVIAALGVNIDKLFSLLFACGCVLAGFAGAMVAPILSVENGMGDSILILTFVVIVVGGVGSVNGAFLAALLVGFIDMLGRTFGPIILSHVFQPEVASQVAQVLGPMLIYILMATVLFYKPDGLFGQRPN